MKLSPVNVTIAAVTCLSLFTAGCNQNTTLDAQAAAQPTSTVAVPTVAVLPANKATGVVTSSAIKLAYSGPAADQVNVSVSGPDSKPVAGELSSDRSQWIPSAQLAWAATYRVSVKVGNSRVENTVTSTFTTMSKPGLSKLVGADLSVSDGQTVGVGMPIGIDFSRSITDRKAVERRLQVVSTPAVEGSWHWFSSSQVHYRPKTYWPVGTKISVKAAIGGLPFGGKYYGKRDRVAHLTVGDKIVSYVDNARKIMTVRKNGTVIRQMPVSLGKPSTPTSSGIHVVMNKAESLIFDSSTFGLPNTAPGGYRLRVYYDVRLTDGGEFVHAAPWSVGVQGKYNVSHGCVNVSTSNAKWFYQISKPGDIVEIVGTETKVSPGNGWTDWNLSWEAYKAGSALNPK